MQREWGGADFLLNSAGASMPEGMREITEVKRLD
jgi:hypothetical protein